MAAGRRGQSLQLGAGATQGGGAAQVGGQAALAQGQGGAGAGVGAFGDVRSSLSQVYIKSLIH